MTVDLVSLDVVLTNCMADRLEGLEHNCVECAFFDDCFDSVVDLVELPFSDFPLDPEE